MRLLYGNFGPHGYSLVYKDDDGVTKETTPVPFTQVQDDITLTVAKRDLPLVERILAGDGRNPNGIPIGHVMEIHGTRTGRLNSLWGWATEISNRKSFPVWKLTNFSDITYWEYAADAKVQWRCMQWYCGNPASIPNDRAIVQWDQSEALKQWAQWPINVAWYGLSPQLKGRMLSARPKLWNWLLTNLMAEALSRKILYDEVCPLEEKNDETVA